MFKSKESALTTLETVRIEYVAQARAVAEQLGQGGAIVTVDDVRLQCPPPADVDGRVMGAILRAPNWELVGYRRSNRRTCHKRPIGEFRMSA